MTVFMVIRKVGPFMGITAITAICPYISSSVDAALSASLRTADRDLGKEVLADISRIVEQIRGRWSRVRILIRGDSGFARDSLMTWCEDNHVDFLFGFAGNPRLYDRIASLSAEVRDAATSTGKVARGFASFGWITKDSWTRRRRVVAKAEWRHGNRYHRFIVTTLPQGMSDPRHLYEQIYCARGDMENRCCCRLDQALTGPRTKPGGNGQH